jgi:hypothetical protein
MSQRERARASESGSKLPHSKRPLWSAGACSRFVARKLASGVAELNYRVALDVPARASSRQRKRQQAAALQATPLECGSLLPLCGSQACPRFPVQKLASGAAQLNFRVALDVPARASSRPRKRQQAAALQRRQIFYTRPWKFALEYVWPPRRKGREIRATPGGFLLVLCHWR